MKNRFLSLRISSIFGTAGIYGLMELQSFIHRTRDPEYAAMINELAEFAIPDLGLVLIFFTVVYPYQIAVLFLQEHFKLWKLTSFRVALSVLIISTMIYSIGFTLIFRSQYLGIQDTIQTFGIGILIFSVYFLINLKTDHFLKNTRIKFLKSA